MGFKSFFKELKRRNIYKVATVYIITGWILIQVITSIFPAFEFPQWTTQFVIILILIGFPMALVFAWAFEVTPEGIKRTRKVPAEDSNSDHTGKQLNYLIIGLLSMALLLIVAERIWFAGTYSPTTGPKDAPLEASVAVLPFDDFSPEGNQQWFSDGLTEEILNSLARLSELRVVARSSSFLFRDKKLPVTEIADSLKVNHIVEGSVRRSGNSMRITAQLIRAEDGSHLWSDTYSRHIDSVFVVQEDIAENIATALDVYLNDKKRQQMFLFGTRNVRAYEAYLKGMSFYNNAHTSGDINGLWKANNLFEKATALDPEFAAAYYDHHDAYYHMINGFASPPNDTLTKEKAYQFMLDDLSKAIEHSDPSGLQFIYRLIRSYYSNNWKPIADLIDSLKQDEDLQEKYIRSCCSWQHQLLMITGNAQLAHRLIKKAVKRDPQNERLKASLANSFMALGQPDSALYHYDGVRVKNINAMLFKKLIALVRTENWEEAKSLEQKFLSVKPSIVDGFRGKSVPEIEGGSFVSPIEKAIYHFSAGNQHHANNIAQEIDQSILGPQQLMEFIVMMGGIIPFDKSTTPKLYERFDEAGVEVMEYKIANRNAYTVLQN